MSQKSPKEIAIAARSSEYGVHQFFLQRWSPRAMSGDTISDHELYTCFEAAGWAPSTYNEQEWRFLYAKKDSEHWDMFFGLLVEANQTWCKNASHLIVVLSRKTFVRNDKPNPVHSLDTGMAVQNLLLQAAEMNLVGHGMAGFDRETATKYLGVPDDFQVEAMIALGKPGDASALPAELQSREEPSDRKSLEKIAVEGRFSFEE